MKRVNGTDHAILRAFDANDEMVSVCLLTASGYFVSGTSITQAEMRDRILKEEPEVILFEVEYPE